MSISALYPDMTAARLGISIVDGIFGAGAVLSIFYMSSSFGDLLPYATVIIVTAVTFIASFLTNMVFSSIGDCSFDGGKLSLNSLYPAVPAGIVTILFFLIEPFVGIFAFPFNTIRFPMTFSAKWKMASIFGLAFAIFWTMVYGQIFASAKSEVCDESV
jgi:hypothetical protein